MSISLSMDVIGLEAMNEMLHTWKMLASRVRSVELLPYPRGDGGPSNAQLLQWHADPKGGARYPKRDFITASDADGEAISQAFINEAKIELTKQHRRTLAREKRKAKIAAGKKLRLGPAPNADRLANQLASKAYKAAMLKYMEQVEARIEAGRSNSGSIEKLSPKYAARKRDKKGFEEPILVYTGQLKENLDSGGLGGKNVRVRRGK